MYMPQTSKCKSAINPREGKDVLGGIKITILNYAKSGEKRFNLVFTNGRHFHTDDKEKFLNYLKVAI